MTQPASECVEVSIWTFEDGSDDRRLCLAALCGCGETFGPYSDILAAIDGVRPHYTGGRRTA